MNDDFGSIEQMAGGLLRNLAPAGRRSLLRKLARGIRERQSQRISAQKAPDGSAFTGRKKRREARPGAYALRFLYPKGSATPREVFMKSWVRQGPIFTGYDIEAGGIRSFFWDKVARFLPVEPGEQNAGAGKIRQRGTLRRKAMFRKLRTMRHLRAGATDAEAWIGFTGRAAEIARVHQEGAFDRPSIKAKPVRYAMRGLLGLTEGERGMALDMLLEHVAAD